MNVPGSQETAGLIPDDDRIVSLDEVPAHIAALFDHSERGGIPKKKSLQPYEQQIIAEMQFRLMGYTTEGSQISWKKDVNNVTAVEKQLVINPEELKADFAHMRELKQQGSNDPQIEEWVRAHTRYGRSGYHAYRNSKDVLYRVRREGIILIAGLQRKTGKFHPVGYNYTLENMPQSDGEFRLLSRETLTAPQFALNGLEPDQTAVNWRTGIAEHIDASVLRGLGFSIPAGIEKVSMRRLGIASATKRILVHILQMRKKRHIVFNIGNIYDAQSDAMIRNTPSFHHNTRIFGDEGLGYRSELSHIVIKGNTDETLGMRDNVGTIRWYARKDEISDAADHLSKPDAVLAMRGWDEPRLLNTAERIAHLLTKERGQ